MRHGSGSWEDDDVGARRHGLLVSGAVWNSKPDVNGEGGGEAAEEEGGSSGEVFQSAATGPAADERNQLLFERNRLRHHKRQLEELLDHSEDANKQLSDAVRSLEAELVGLRRTGQQLKRRLDDETARSDEMERRAGQSEMLGESLRLEVGRLRERSSRLKGELRQSQGSIAEHLRDVAEKKSCIKKLEADLAGLRRSCSRLMQAEGDGPSASPSIREEILLESSHLLNSGPSPFCEKPPEAPTEAAEAVAEATQTGDGKESMVDLDVSQLLEERNRYRQQLQEVMDRMRSTASIIQHNLLEKFSALERQVRLERQENCRLTEQLKRSSWQRWAVRSDQACQVGEPFMGPEHGRYNSKFPRSLFHHRRLSTGRICKSFKPLLPESRHRLGSSVDALDLAVKSSVATDAQAAGAATDPTVQDNRSRRVPAAASAAADEAATNSHSQPTDSNMATAGGSNHHGNHFLRRKRRVSFGEPLSQVSPEHEKYLLDLVRRPVQDDDSLTEEDKRVSSLLLRQAAEASRHREDSASSPDGSPRHLQRPSRTSSSFMSSLKESDYSTWSQSEPQGASISISVDDISQSQSQAEEPEPLETAASAATSSALSTASAIPRRASAEAATKEATPFPSLPNSRLRELALLPASLTELDARNGSVSLIDPSRRYRLDDVPDSELEDRVRSLAISFSNDAITLVGRVKRLYLARTNLERNIASELAALEAELGAPPSSPAGLRVLRDSVDKLNRTAEIFGAVQQESRLNYAFHLMLKYMELLKEEKESQSTELEQMRQAMEEGKFFMPDEEIMSKRSKSVIGGAKEGQRSKFQELGRSIARTSSITSIRRKISRERKAADYAASDSARGKDRKWKIEEEIYQSGFERGLRMSASQQLSQLKTEQATFSEQLEKMLDRQHMTEGEEADLDKLSSDWLSDKRVRLFLAPFTLLVGLMFLLWAVAYPVVRQILGR